MAIHGKNVDCSICGIEIASKEQLKRHIAESHNSTKKHKCYFCDELFLIPSMLERHVTNMHKEKSKDHKCDKCDKCYYEYSSLRLHKATVHERVKDVQCNLCKKIFSSRNSLVTHEKLTHYKPKEYSDTKRKLKCDICEKYFINTVSLKLHLDAVHGTGAKNYVCEVCNKAYVRKSVLSLHKKSVHGNNVECFQCKKEFANEERLKHHISVVHKLGHLRITILSDIIYSISTFK